MAFGQGNGSVAYLERGVVVNLFLGQDVPENGETRSLPVPVEILIRFREHTTMHFTYR